MRFQGNGAHRYGDALLIDGARGTVSCGHCDAVLGVTGEDLLPGLGEFSEPLRAAGPVRGEDYDRGRFRLRQLCCPKCGALIDAQVACGDSPRPRIVIDFGLPADPPTR